LRAEDHTSLTIKVVTRDRPSTLQRAIEQLFIDLQGSRLKAVVLVVDDSTGVQQRFANRSLLVDLADTYNCMVYYGGREEYTQLLDRLNEKISQWLLNVVGQLGDVDYCPSRPRNIASLFNVGSEYELLLDDDILLDPKALCKQSIVQIAVSESKRFNAFVSVALKGIIDKSIDHLFELCRIQETKRKAHPWTTRKDNAQFNLSGGFLVHPSLEKPTIFPRIYNEDFLWIGYCLAEQKRLPRELSLEVYHYPDKLKVFSLERLIYEAKGEILNAAFNTMNADDMLAFYLPPRDVVQSLISEYRDYIVMLYSLVDEREWAHTPAEQSITVPDAAQCIEILKRFSTYLSEIRFETMSKFLQDWSSQISQWPEIVDAIGRDHWQVLIHDF